MYRPPPILFVLCIAIFHFRPNPASAQDLAWIRVGEIEPGASVLASPDGSLYSYNLRYSPLDLRQSADGGLTWSSWPPTDGAPFQLPTALDVDDQGSVYVAQSFIRGMLAGTVKRSSGIGEAWINLDAGSQADSYVFTYTWIRDIEFNDHGDIFVGTYRGLNTSIEWPHGLFRSSDAGESWQLLTDSSFAPDGIYAMSMNRTGIIYATAPPHLFRSRDHGESWESVEDDPFLRNLPQRKVHAVTADGHLLVSHEGSAYWVSSDGSTGMSILPASPRIVKRGQNEEFFAAVSGVIYRSDPGGRSWRAISTGVQFGTVYSIALTSEGLLYASTDSGFFRTTSPVSPTASGHEVELNERPALENFPNPFVGQTTFSVSLPRSAASNLTLFDTTGRLVATVFDGWLPAGSHRFPLTDVGLSSGVYIARLNSNGVVAIRMVLVL